MTDTWYSKAGADAQFATQAGLATVATTGSYNDLNDKPAPNTAFVPGLIVPPVGAYLGGYGVSAIQQNTQAFFNATGVDMGSVKVTPLRIFVPGPMTFDTATLWVDAAQADANAKILLYTLGADGYTATLARATAGVSLASNGAKTIALPTPLVVTGPCELLAAVICDQTTAGTARLRAATQVIYPQIDMAAAGLSATGNTFTIAPGTYASPDATPVVKWLSNDGWNFDFRAVVGLHRSA